ncbi:MAG: ribosomal protein L7/L12 [Methanomassiliicoccaceae archaeon]|nr:ribosomal protein L7/L12 [Methanomassiliicoccaceae archaeon]
MFESLKRPKKADTVEKPAPLAKKETAAVNATETKRVKKTSPNEDIEPPPQKDIYAPSLYIVNLLSFGEHKVDVIKAVRVILDCGLKEGKDLVETKPKPVKVKEFTSEDEAREAADIMTKAGATIEFITYVVIESNYTAEEQTLFDVYLMSFGEHKVDVIKAVREITGLGLKDATDLVNAAPKAVKEFLPIEEAEEVAEKLRNAGGVAEIR